MSSSTEPVPKGGPLALIGQVDEGLSELTETSWWAVADGDLLRAAIAVETAWRKLEAARLVLVAEINARGHRNPSRFAVHGWLADRRDAAGSG
jgi:hypothetical protein